MRWRDVAKRVLDAMEDVITGDGETRRMTASESEIRDLPGGDEPDRQDGQR